MSKLGRLFYLSCPKATLLMEKRTVQPLGVVDTFRLNWHRSICETCRTFEKQSLLLEQLLDKHIHSLDQDPPIIENKPLQERIISSL